MTIAVITRFHYPKDHPNFEWRFNFYKEKVLPRLLKQTDQDFEIWIWCEPHHDEMLLALSDKIRVFHGTYEPRKSKYHIDFAPYENFEGLPKFEVQCGLDSDELVEPDYIEIIRKHSTGPKSRCIVFQGILLDVKTGRQYHMRRKYGRHFGSAMFALYQPDLTNYHFILSTSGHRTPKYAAETIVIPEGHVMVGVHGRNASTRVEKECKPIYPWGKVWTTRANTAAKYLPEGASVIDLGGGYNQLHHLRPDLDYKSVDIEAWTPLTVKADLNDNFPLLPKADYVICLGILEYITNHLFFVDHLKYYGEKLILSYRLESTGGMKRQNNFSFEEVKKIISDWLVVDEITTTPMERIFICVPNR